MNVHFLFCPGHVWRERDVRTPDRQTIRSSQRDIIMPDLACDLFENAICLSRFIELEKVSTSAVGKKKRFNEIDRRSNLISFPFSLFIHFVFIFWRLSKSSAKSCVVALKFGLTGVVVSPFQMVIKFFWRLIST